MPFDAVGMACVRKLNTTSFFVPSYVFYVYIKTVIYVDEHSSLNISIYCHSCQMRPRRPLRTAIAEFLGSPRPSATARVSCA